MLGVVEYIQKIARTDRRIEKILTGCIRVTETANHDGEVEFLLPELKSFCDDAGFPLQHATGQLNCGNYQTMVYYIRCWRIQLLKS